MSVEPVTKHTRIIGALMLREVITRYGREGLGFIWLVGEPLLFCFGILILWSVIKPAYEHGIRLGPFVMTGYMCLILLRHQISFSMSALQANVGLMHHRQVSALHLFVARNLLEFAGTTAAFIVVYTVLLTLRQVSLPHDYLLLYAGWCLMGWIGMGLGLTLAGLAMQFDILERLVPVLTYALIPLSGAFFMVEWLPPHVRETYLLIPMPHGVEMIRAAVFGEFVKTHYNPLYAVTVGAMLNIVGLLLIAKGKNRLDAE